jgi:outer membrane lipoprotein-sorting protein
MMKRRYLFVACLFLLSGGPGRGIEPQQLLEKVDQAEFAAGDTTARVKMQLVEPDGKTFERRLVMYQKGNNKRLIRFESPADVQGVSFLDAEGKIYVYLPAFHKIRLVAGSMKNENFAGTDFAHEDLSSERFSDRLQAVELREEGDHFILTTKDKNKDSRYSKLIFRIRKADFLFDRVEYYDRNGELWKEFVREDFRLVKSYTQSFQAQMTDHRRKHSTRMIVEQLEVDKGLPDSLFSKRQLKR